MGLMDRIEKTKQVKKPKAKSAVRPKKKTVKKPIKKRIQKKKTVKRTIKKTPVKKRAAKPKKRTIKKTVKKAPVKKKSKIIAKKSAKKKATKQPQKKKSAKKTGLKKTAGKPEKKERHKKWKVFNQLMGKFSSDAHNLANSEKEELNKVAGNKLAKNKKKKSMFKKNPKEEKKKPVEISKMKIKHTDDFNRHVDRLHDLNIKVLKRVGKDPDRSYKGKELISKALKKLNIRYIPEFYLGNLKHHEDEHVITDFFLPKERIHIEYCRRWDESAEEKKMYDERRNVYSRNGLSCIFILPKQLTDIVSVLDQEIAAINSPKKADESGKKSIGSLFKNLFSKPQKQ